MSSKSLSPISPGTRAKIVGPLETLVACGFTPSFALGIIGSECVIDALTETGRYDVTLADGSAGWYIDRESLDQIPTGIEAQVCADIAARQALGVKKYGSTVASNKGDLKYWLQHAFEECLDQAVYLKRAMVELEEGK